MVNLGDISSKMNGKTVRAVCLVTVFLCAFFLSDHWWDIALVIAFVFAVRIHTIELFIEEEQKKKRRDSSW